MLEWEPGDGRLSVTFPPRLADLVREVRQLSALGLPVPARVQEVASTAMRFFRQANRLQQVSTSKLPKIYQFELKLIAQLVH